MVAIRHGEPGERTVRDLVAALIIEASSAFETDHCRARHCLQRAAELIQRKPPAEAAPGRESPAARGGLARWQSSKVVAYVQANIGGRISTDQLAAHVNLSVGHFFRAFRASFGATPHTYVMRQRIRHAQVLMAGSDAPLARIAFDCGLCDQAHFSRAFRRAVGVSPNAWRRQVASGQAPAAARQSS